MRTSLEGGFEAFWADAGKRTSDRSGLRQAYKNGAALIGGRLIVKGRGAVLAMAAQGHVTNMRQLWPWVVGNLKAHPDWGEDHKFAVIAGGFAAIMLVNCGLELLEELENFDPEE